MIRITHSEHQLMGLEYFKRNFLVLDGIGETLCRFVESHQTSLESSFEFVDLNDIYASKLRNNLTADLLALTQSPGMSDQSTVLLLDNWFEFNDRQRSGDLLALDEFKPYLVYDLGQSSHLDREIVEDGLKNCMSFTPVCFISTMEDVRRQDQAIDFDIEYSSVAIAAFDQEGWLAWQAR